MGIPLLVSMIQSDRERLHRLSTEKKAITSDDGKLRVTVTGMWTKMSGLNKQASLQVGDKSARMFLMVISDAKAEVPNLTLETHHQLTRDRMLGKMKNASATQPVSLTIDGHAALQDELTGIEKGPALFHEKWVFLHITVDDGDRYQQILAWTLKSRWQNRINCCVKSREVFATRNSVIWLISGREPPWVHELDARCPGLFRSVADDREFIGDSIAVEIRSYAARGAGERNH